MYFNVELRIKDQETVCCRLTEPGGEMCAMEDNSLPTIFATLSPTQIFAIQIKSYICLLPSYCFIRPSRWGNNYESVIGLKQSEDIGENRHG